MQGSSVKSARWHRGSLVVVLCLLVTGCALFKKQPAPQAWSGSIETYAPGVEVMPVALADTASDATPVDVNALPSGLTGPNPAGGGDGLVKQLISKALPGVELPVTSEVPTQNLTAAQQASQASEDSTGWMWNDRARKWTLTASKMPETQAWLYESEALLLRISAQDELNVFEGASHATVIKVIQLDNPKNFNRLRQDPFGLADMLTQAALDPSFIAEKQLYLMPGGSITLTLDREEGVRYVGILAGYYRLDEYKTVSRLIRIPAVSESLETGLLTRLWPLSKEVVLQRPARLKIWLDAGEQQIDSVAIQVN
ncbi:type VI secretion system lipoprotein TssJ [Reinekea sp.]|uniref:type VI secretion system lipoprotein TssJ n=1 Tax=Reinekea sp. TaxID=1970455 RepID=UPI002A82532A|nr:type VI secretion system lipoprotein TssJ [Reinekea sp.]